ncbi:uncharacterized protein BO97DRAFT_443098 [Aspergillus homomorphus CBS 101889]|uniref:Uncharacterized protein n=1 Tax=Aspergillus homomorphus (strain CBS 101889) TaxID=1450537 RepID=A0A395HXF7_ASPHC|nr:hypothetical protein BO97DRAFT_443098 [Aspergillus homomorphus CBS 101889]RAL12487.1 hypothetical protein BO97DRAFT_443098 [Aspergillus homomorphus CBS 101889]
MKMEDFVCPSLTFQPSCPPHLTLPQDAKFGFTPVKSLSRSAPHVWDRKPSTSFRARGRSRKVWKRFRSSFNSMKALQQITVGERHTIDEELQLEINNGRNPGLVRGVKRRCSAWDTDDLANGDSRGRSFLETQWESESKGRRRKLPLVYSDFVELTDEPMETDSLQPHDILRDTGLEQDASTLDHENLIVSAPDELAPTDLPETPTKLVPGAPYPRMLPGDPESLPAGLDCGMTNIKGHEIGHASPFTLFSPVVGLSTPDTPTIKSAEDGSDYGDVAATIENVLLSAKKVDSNSETAAIIPDLTVEQESTLVRSALRSSLDGEDAELLSNFLFKAQAKREAKAAAAVAEAEAAEAAEMVAKKAALVEKEDEAKKVRESSPAELPTPPSRRALEDLDTNSPSPQKSQQVSPAKPREDEVQEAGSPRRSTRPRAPPLRPSTVAAAVRSTFSLRRAKGNEFVFLQRTEAQEIALATKRNTRHNKGNSTMPKQTLQVLADHKSDTTPIGDDKAAAAARVVRGSTKAKKHVSWNNEQLVQFEGEDPSATDHRHDVAGAAGRGEMQRSTDKLSDAKRKAATGRTTRSQSGQRTGVSTGPDAATTAPATATPRARRVRTASKPESNSVAAPAAAPAPTSSPTSSSSSSGVESPLGQRKKLIPKSPRKAPETPSKGSTSVTAGTTSSSSKTSLRSSSTRTSLLKVNAGSTPVARRIRSRS